MEGSRGWENLSAIMKPCLVRTFAFEIVAGPLSTTLTVKLAVWLSGGEPLSVTTTWNE